jgi:lipoprotein-anchoring transpeptidase ErfK/SrfK
MFHRIWSLIGLVLTSSAPLSPPPNLAENFQGPCANAGTRVLVRTVLHRLTLCENGRNVGEWRVELGSGGVSKEVEGDKKTPIGVYKIGRPRKSKAGFGIFIPVGYPNAVDRAAGRSGGDIGIHGPPQDQVHSRAGEARDWTFGCIALPDLASIQTIATWVRRHHPIEVTITANE